MQIHHFEYSLPIFFCLAFHEKNQFLLKESSFVHSFLHKFIHKPIFTDLSRRRRRFGCEFIIFNAKITISNAECIILNATRIILNAQFIILNVKIIILNVKIIIFDETFIRRKTILFGRDRYEESS